MNHVAKGWALRALAVRKRYRLGPRTGLGLILLTVQWATGAGCPSPADREGLLPEPAELTSWNEGAAKTAIVEFVHRVTDRDSPDYVYAGDRIAVFDNDGTLWSEQPFYFQGLFALARVKALAPEHPEWNQQQPFRAALEGDMATLREGGTAALHQILVAAHAGNTTDEFAGVVTDWIATARHPQRHVAFTELTFKPMNELLDYLRANGFRTYIVSGGGVEFMRPWTEEAYGIPPEQVVGSSIKTEFQVRSGLPVLLRLPEVDFVNDGPGKPVAINKFIGRRPLLAFGNSDGDLQMLEWTAAGPGPRFVGLIHHTDGDREWAYDRNSQVGRLDKALEAARQRGWTVVNMKSDWKTVFTGPSSAR
jgi:phosphoglycolate phosphatase-like HAD superfamily hydrolase